MGQNSSKRSNLGKNWVKIDDSGLGEASGIVEIVALPEIIEFLGSLLGIRFRPIGRFRGIAMIKGKTAADLVVALNGLLRSFWPARLLSLRTQKITLREIVAENNSMLNALEADVARVSLPGDIGSSVAETPERPWQPASRERPERQPASRERPERQMARERPERQMARERPERPERQPEIEDPFVGDVQSGLPIESEIYWSARFREGFSGDPYNRSSAEAQTQQSLRKYKEIETFISDFAGSRERRGYNSSFLPGAASVYYRAGSDTQTPIPYRGNVPKGTRYPEFADYMKYGCVTTGCKMLE
jgi:hypothetical protein